MLITETVEFGGCAAKLGLGDLRRYLGALRNSPNDQVLVGLDARDDAAVLRIGTADICATLDFITPIVPDPYLYGQIAAANALSDVYAMGGIPHSSLLIAGLDPRIEDDVNIAMLQGAFDKSNEAGAPVVGGHTILSNGIKLGLSVIGRQETPPLLHSNARPGDVVHLTKPLGTGVYSNAVKQGLVPFASDAPEVASMVRLNDEAARWAVQAGARCATDVTGFGLLGHLHNLCRASNVRIEVDAAAVPLFPETRRYVEAGMVTSGARRSRQALQGFVDAPGCPDWLFEALLDPQTSGGLAVLTAAAAPPEGGPIERAPIGRVLAGPPGITVRC